ncbi:beta-1,4-N-acetylgalactosaminyltransferase bre-4 [Lingula anatina]|uniref:Beta-1,4-galactosyltransferase n=1 Tax=Lingula anatina TaxID=7574 RepID=A0A1S3IHZ0_LINAN|nr:beta-1,4-N-acetylgalactosaminyltransferase bre-4 [Lingula anatina]|eukprot:XP_013397832.1 beta-1,4-N-acetylgalactosaminyltransferase bre-4 [Lingula anatina]
MWTATMLFSSTLRVLNSRFKARTATVLLCVSLFFTFSTLFRLPSQPALTESPHRTSQGTVKATGLPPCRYPDPGLVGKLRPQLTSLPLSLRDLSEKFPDIRGGHWKPSDCVPQFRVLLIIPFRDRWLHLSQFLDHYIPILQRQKIDFRIVVSEQNGTDSFNKGRVMNAAYLESNKEFGFDCVIFHDIDALLEDDRNLYVCPSTPRHLAPAVSRHNYTLKYPSLVGTALAFPNKHFEKVNGFSNSFWGWGGEDDEMAKRILASGLIIERPPTDIGRYTLIEHTKNKRVLQMEIQQHLIQATQFRMFFDGISTVKYKVLAKNVTPLFVHYIFDIGSLDPFELRRLYQSAERNRRFLQRRYIWR